MAALAERPASALPLLVLICILSAHRIINNEPVYASGCAFRKGSELHSAGSSRLIDLTTTPHLHSMCKGSEAPLHMAGKRTPLQKTPPPSNIGSDLHQVCTSNY
jgi:hypothetical protein